MNNNTFDVGYGDVPAAWQPGSSGRNKRILSFFLLALLAMFWLQAGADRARASWAAGSRRQLLSGWLTLT